MHTSYIVPPPGVIASPHIRIAAHSWIAEHAPESGPLYQLVMFLFETLDALYVEVSRMPAQWASSAPLGIQSGGVRSMYLALLPAPGWALLRSLVGLAGDAYCIAKRMDTHSQGLELHGDVVALITELDRFRQARNFFAHLDQRLAAPEHHGITGSASTRCGIQYAGATACMHIAVVGNWLHFSSEGAPQELDVSKDSFLRLLRSARPLYAKLISEHSSPYPVPAPAPADQVYV